MSENRPLMRLASHLLNRPLATTDFHAQMILAALHSDMNISVIQDLEGNSMDRRQMTAYSAAGRQRADMKRKRRDERKVFMESNGVAIIPVTDTLTKTWGLEPYSGHTGYDGIKMKLWAALEDDDIDAILFDIDSPGGAVSGLFDLVDLIHAANERNGGKLIWCMANEQACSAAYAILTAGDRSFVARTGDVGSVGIVYLHTDAQKKHEMEGLKVTVFRAGRDKMAINPVEDIPESAIAEIDETLGNLRTMFIDTCARNLDHSGKRLAQLTKALTDSEGRTYMGSRARDMKLINDVASEDQVWAQLMKRLGR